MNCIEADNIIHFENLTNRKLKMSTEVIESLIAQLEASKQMYNEALNSLYQVRTHNVALQRQMSVINNRLTELEKAKAAEVATQVPATVALEDFYQEQAKVCDAESDGYPDGMTATDVA